MSDQKLLQTSSRNDLAWLEEVSDVTDLEGCVSEVCRKTRRYPYLIGSLCIRSDTSRQYRLADTGSV